MLSSAAGSFTQSCTSGALKADTSHGVLHSDNLVDTTFDCRFSNPTLLPSETSGDIRSKKRLRVQERPREAPVHKTRNCMDDFSSAAPCSPRGSNHPDLQAAKVGLCRNSQNLVSYPSTPVRKKTTSGSTCRYPAWMVRKGPVIFTDATVHRVSSTDRSRVLPHPPLVDVHDKRWVHCYSGKPPAITASAGLASCGKRHPSSRTQQARLCQPRSSHRRGNVETCLASQGLVEKAKPPLSEFDAKGTA